MLVGVVDRTGRADAVRVQRAFEDVEGRLASHDLRVRWPVSLEVVSMPIMGATKSTRKHHALFVSLGAVRSGMLDGLLAHEMGHMIRTEQRHASHDPALFERMGQMVRIPRAGQEVFGEAFNHVQDIYADDLSFRVGLGDRAYRFFASWVDGHVPSRSKGRWWNVGASVSNGFALGNLKRHGLLADSDPLWSRARRFDRQAGLQAVDGFATFFATLPEDPEPGVFLERVQALAVSMARAADSRSL